ncbi:unnamed protein product [Orchesella dallaii]|uniref:Uncharacterized protein n=1 Tax=Orchesella dallaii TaxID=48710 RepID=A0ABP1R790_9HEXA
MEEVEDVTAAINFNNKANQILNGHGKHRGGASSDTGVMTGVTVDNTHTGSNSWWRGGGGGDNGGGCDTSAGGGWGGGCDTSAGGGWGGGCDSGGGNSSCN